MELYSGDIARLAAGMRLFVGARQVTAQKSSPGRKGLFTLYVEGVTDRDSANQLRGLDIELPERDLPRPAEGVYYHYQLIGSRVVDRAGSPIGVLSGIMETGSNDVYVVAADDGHEILVPATKSTVLGIDTVKREVTVDLPGAEPAEDIDGEDE